MPNFTIRTDWFANAIRSHRHVTNAIALHNGTVQIERRKVPPITVMPIATDRIDQGTVEAVFETGVPTVIVLVPKMAHYDWTARMFAEENGSTIHTMKELYTFMHEADPRTFVDKNVSYSRQRLSQHSKVLDANMICEASMLFKRHVGLDDVTVGVEYEYEFSEEALVRALDRHPGVDVILNSNPNGRPTGAALSHARDAEVPIFDIGGLMGALNYDGERFRTYEPSRTTW